MSREYEGLRQEIWRLSQLEDNDQRVDAARDEALAAAQAAMSALLQSSRAEMQANRAKDEPWLWFERVWALGALLLYLWARRRRMCRRWQRRRQMAAQAALVVELEAGPPGLEEVVVAAGPIQQDMVVAVAQVPEAMGWGANLRGWPRGPQSAPAV